MSTGKPSAGKLRERVTLYRRATINPDAPADLGRVRSVWTAQGSVAAEYIHLRGGETVMAGRLVGRHPAIIRIRASTQTKRIRTDWRAVDARTETIWEFRDVTLTADRAWIEILAESGVTGMERVGSVEPVTADGEQVTQHGAPVTVTA